MAAAAVVQQVPAVLGRLRLLPEGEIRQKRGGTGDEKDVFCGHS
jgi:hypothetical protein